MIPDIRNPYLRRLALVFTVAAIIVCLGPVTIILRVLRWIEDEFETDLRAVWHGKQPKGKL